MSCTSLKTSRSAGQLIKRTSNIEPARFFTELEYRFSDAALLARALTHRSAGNDNNERLEFLGDALLNFVIAEVVFDKFPKLPEGDLSRVRSALVRESSLALVARDIRLGDHVRLGSGELKSGGFRRDSILADALEAIIGAVLLDGGFQAARTMILRLFQSQIEELPDPCQLKDCKTRLQEFLQAQRRPLPDYQVLCEDGPPHQRRFSIRCSLPDADLVTNGEGNSRKDAEQIAAERMLILLEHKTASVSKGKVMGRA